MFYYKACVHTNTMSATLRVPPVLSSTPAQLEMACMNPKGHTGQLFPTQLNIYFVLLCKLLVGCLVHQVENHQNTKSKSSTQI